MDATKIIESECESTRANLLSCAMSTSPEVYKNPIDDATGIHALEEVAWKKNYELWMTFINEYKNRGGRVTAGSDSGFIFQLYGFAFIRELELLREAGFHPLEVIRSATLSGAEALGMDNEIGTVAIGKLADFVVVDANPLKNLKVLYGTGAIKLTENNEVVREGGVKYTIKDGIIYDAKALLQEVKAMVDAEKAKTGYKILQPGVKE